MAALELVLEWALDLMDTSVLEVVLGLVLDLVVAVHELLLDLVDVSVITMKKPPMMLRPTNQPTVRHQRRRSRR